MKYRKEENRVQQNCIPEHGKYSDKQTITLSLQLSHEALYIFAIVTRRPDTGCEKPERMWILWNL